MLSDQKIISLAKETLQIEAESVLGLMEMLNEDFTSAIKLIHSSEGRVVVSGIGKSAIMLYTVI